MEPATRIERATCGLRISPHPTSHNLNPQETTNQDAPEVGADGPELSCPGSSVVADAEGEAARFENTPIPEPIGSNRDQSFSSQSFGQESETGEEPVERDRIA